MARNVIRLYVINNINLIRCVCAYFTYSSSGQQSLTTISKRLQVTHARRTHLAKFTVVDNQHMLLRHRHGPVFYRQLFKIKAGSAFTDMHARSGIKAISGQKIIQRLLKIDGFENGVAGVKFTTTKKRGNGVSLSAPEKYLANNKRR